MKTEALILLDTVFTSASTNRSELNNYKNF